MENIRNEVLFLRGQGITLQRIRNELKQRDIPEIELRYSGITSHNTSEEINILYKYSTKQLKSIEIVMQEIEKGEKEMDTSQFNIYNQIKAKLEAATTMEELTAAYKWLANRFVETNESAKDFEEKFIARYGREEFGILLYGSKEAYDKAQNFEKRMMEASTPNERMSILLDSLLSDGADREEVEEYPDIFEENEDLSRAE